VCNESCLSFVQKSFDKKSVRGLRCLEVGSLNVNGSTTELLQRLEPELYLGVDIANGPGVDELCDAEDLVSRFGWESFDVVISTEMVEHVADWRAVMSNLKNVVKPGGKLLLTTRSFGFPLHDYPADYWRYEPEDMRLIFTDFESLVVESDPKDPGVFITAVKPHRFVEADLSGIALYSMLSGTRAISLQHAEWLIAMKQELDSLRSEATRQAGVIDEYEQLRILRFSAPLRRRYASLRRRRSPGDPPAS